MTDLLNLILELGDSPSRLSSRPRLGLRPRSTITNSLWVKITTFSLWPLIDVDLFIFSSRIYKTTQLSKVAFRFTSKTLGVEEKLKLQICIS